MLALGGSIASYATDQPTPALLFWELLFKNASILLIGSDDFTPDMRRAAAADINAAFETGWGGYELAEVLPLPKSPGRMS